MKQDTPRVSLLFRLFGYAFSYKYCLLLAVGCMMLFGLAKASVAWLAKVLVDGGALNFGQGAKAPDLAAKAAAGVPFSASLQPLIQGFVASDIHTRVLFIGGAIAILAAVMFLTEFGSYYLSGYVTQRILIDIRCHLCRQMLGMSIAFFNDRRQGDLISRLTNDIMVTNYGIKLLLGDVVKQCFVAASCVAGLLLISWQLTVTALITVPLLGLLLRKLSRRVFKASKRSLENYSELTDAMTQMFSGIRVVKVFNMEHREMEEFESISNRLFRTYMKVIGARGLSRAMTAGLSHLIIGAAVCLGLYLIHWHLMLPGELAAAIVLVATLNRPLKAITRASNDVGEGLGAAERIFDLLDAHPEVAESKEAVDLPKEYSGIRFRNLSFAYNGEDVLRNIDLEIPAGKLVAIVGHSGSGKSTLLDLIARFYDPQSGAIEVGGIDLRSVRRASLLDKIAFVTQQTFLFNTSLEENIRYGRPSAGPEEVREAARLARIDDFARELPEGYETLVGDQGVKLSGGQRQRISLARAFLKNAQILILDEATSQLDTQTERKIQDSLKKVSAGRTTFVVAHRLSTVQDADRIIVLDQGQVVEVGSHQELMARNGHYRKLYMLQFSAPEAAAPAGGPESGAGAPLPATTSEEKDGRVQQRS